MIKVVWKELSKSECEKIMSENQSMLTPSPVTEFDKCLKERLTKEYFLVKEIKESLLDGNPLAQFPDNHGFAWMDTDIKKDLKECFVRKRTYLIDLLYGFKLYRLLKEEYGFSERLASNDGVWRYISMKIIPHVITDRNENQIHPDSLYRIPRRNYLKRIWWYIHLAWQTIESDSTCLVSDKQMQKYDLEEYMTYKVIKKGNTDWIQGFVERPGYNGYRVQLIRAMLKKFSEENKLADRKVIREILKLNIALVMTTEPVLFENGIEGYVKYLVEKSIFGDDNE